jgi:hypothetical protein
MIATMTVSKPPYHFTNSILFLVMAAAVQPCWPAATGDLSLQISNNFTLGTVAFGAKPRLVINDGEEISSSPQGEVRFGLTAMQRALSNVQPDARLATIQFYVAHEIWHQRQFQQYGTKILDKDESEPRLYECQADLLAAKYVLENTPDAFAANHIATEGVAGQAYAMGIPIHPAGLHPSPEQRRTAVLFGFTLAILEPKLLSAYKAALKLTNDDSETINYLNHILDKQPDENDSEWSMKVCKRIIHYHDEAVQAISLGNASVNFNHDPQAPFVAYSIPYRNISKRPVHVELVVQSVAVARKDPTNVWKHELIDVDSRSIDLAPDALYVLSGQLPWYGDKEDYYPRLEFDPKNSRSLIAAEFSGPEVAKASCLNYSPTGLNDFSQKFRNALVKFAAAAGGGFEELQIGTSSISGGDSVSYDSTISIPGGTSTEIEREKNGASEVTADLYRGLSLDEAAKIYGRYRDALLMMCPPIGTPLQESSRNDLPDITISFSATMDVNMYIYKSKQSGKYSVNFILKSVKW